MPCSAKDNGNKAEVTGSSWLSQTLQQFSERTTIGAGILCNLLHVTNQLSSMQWFLRTHNTRTSNSKFTQHRAYIVEVAPSVRQGPHQLIVYHIKVLQLRQQVLVSS